MVVLYWLMALRLAELFCLSSILWWSIFHLPNGKFKNVHLTVGFIILGINFWAVALQIGVLRSEPW